MEIILIDDDGLSLFLTKNMLEKFSPLIQIREFLEPELALDYFKYTDSTFTMPHLIFLDLNLGRIDGLEFVERLVEMNEKYKLLKICILTSSVDDEEKKKVMEVENIFDFISKPITEQKLYKAIAHCLLIDNSNKVTK